MDILIFAEQLEKIVNSIEKKVLMIENNASAGIKAMPELIQEIQAVLPDWFYFIDETGIGDKQAITIILQDIVEAIDNGDGVLLEDALLFGMQSLMIEYINVIKEALDGE